MLISLKTRQFRLAESGGLIPQGEIEKPKVFCDFRKRFLPVDREKRFNNDEVPRWELSFRPPGEWPPGRVPNYPAGIS